jgi:hypothetical protein
MIAFPLSLILCHGESVNDVKDLRADAEGTEAPGAPRGARRVRGKMKPYGKSKGDEGAAREAGERIPPEGQR